MTTFRHITLALSLAFAAVIPQANAQTKLIDEVVASVGDDAILASDIEYQYGQALIEGANTGGDMKCQIFEQLLIQKLLLNQAALDSVEVKDSEVLQQVDARLNYFTQQVGGQDKLEEYFKKPIQQIRRDQTETVRTQLISQRMQQQITKDVKVTPADIKEFFNSVDKDSIPLVPAQYELQQILVYPEVEQKEIDRIKARLRDFQKQVSEGRDFATLAVLYSEDPGSAARGGDLGWYSKTGFVPEFSAVAFNLKEKGKVSKIVETEFGFHIIQLIDRKGDKINCRHILLKPKVTAESRRKGTAFMDTVVKYIDENKLTFEEAAANFSMDKDSRSNGGMMANPEDGTFKFQLSQIPPEIAKAIQNLKEGEISKPFSMIDERKGKETIRIVRLVKRHEPHKANNNDDYDLLKNIVENQKRKQLLDDWIRARQKETYVVITPEWQRCDFEYKGWIQ
ncbi:MAG: peptidylprolyl isomerase [Bacteroidales bacterium]|nr:peptidylprolyl isomerase [Bacteroidales bacterium]